MGLPELPAHRRPLGGQIEQPLGLAAAGRPDPDPSHPQPLPGERQPRAFLAQDLARSETHAGEVEPEREVAPVAHAAIALRDVEALLAHVDQERGDALAGTAGGLVDSSHREHDGEVRHHRAGDEVLGAVEDPVVAVTPGTGLHRHDVGPRLGLGEREQLALLRPRAGQQVALPLIALACEQDLGRPADPGMQRMAGLAVLALDDGHAPVAEPAPTHRLRQVRGVQPGLHGPPLDLASELRRHLAAAVDLVLVRIDLPFHEGSDRVEQHSLLVAQLDIHP